MAKKNVVKMPYMRRINIEAVDDNKCEVTITGCNSNDTEVLITGELGDLQLRHLAESIVKVVEARMSKAEKLRDDIKSEMAKINPL